MNRLQSVHVEIPRRALGKMVGPRRSRCDRDNSVLPGRVRQGEFFQKWGGRKCAVLKNWKNPTRRETNSEFAPEDGWLEDEIPFGMAYLQVLCCGFVDGKAEWELVERSWKHGCLELFTSISKNHLFLDDSICCFNRKCMAQLPELRRCVSKPIGYMYGSTFRQIYAYIYIWVLRVIWKKMLHSSFLFVSLDEFCGPPSVWHINFIVVLLIPPNSHTKSHDTPLIVFDFHLFVLSLPVVWSKENNVALVFWTLLGCPWKLVVGSWDQWL